MKLLKRIKKGESKTLEFKEIVPTNLKVAKTIVAFANTSGGKLIIGVNDEREVVGIKDDIFKLQDRIVSVIHDVCYPNILVDMSTQKIDNRLILIIEVFRGSLLPYYIKGKKKENGTFIRIGATNRKASPENIMELERRKKNISYDEEIDYDIEFSTLNLSPLYIKFNELGFQLQNSQLETLKLIKKENGLFYATHGLLIILGLYSHSSIMCARFKGNLMEEFIDKKEFSSDIFTNLENAVNFILNHTNLKGEIKGIQRVDTYEIPIIALREAIINALVHRDYTNHGRDIKIAIYDDYINIISPGSLPSTITLQDIETGRSEVRNRVIARVFKELKFIEQWGSGIPRIYETCKKQGLKKPIILEKNDSVDVKLFRLIDEKTADSGGKTADSGGKTADSGGKLSINERKILKYLSNTEFTTSKRVKELLNLKDSRTKELLKIMVDKNLINRVGKGRSTYYQIKE